MLQLNNQESFYQLVSNIDWEDAFIKSVKIDCPSELVDEGIISADSLWFVTMIICLPENEDNQICFFFKSVEKINLRPAQDINPQTKYKHNIIEYNLIGGFEYGCDIVCKELFYSFFT